MKYLLSALTVLFTISCTKELLPQQDVIILTSEVDRDGYITASWRYADGRIGGTDFTDKSSMLTLIDDQRSWPACSALGCRYVTLEGQCWRHKPVN